MTVHLIKLSVGPESLTQLEAWQQQRLRAGQELMHVTRQTPKRSAELLGGGSIYWVIKSTIVARQRLAELRPLVIDGVPHCGLVLAPELIRTHPRPRRPFQGWRYLDAKDAPPDLGVGDDAEISDELMRELAVLGLV